MNPKIKECPKCGQTDIQVVSKMRRTNGPSDEQKILDQITFTSGDYDDDGNYEILEVNPIQ